MLNIKKISLLLISGTVLSLNYACNNQQKNEQANDNKQNIQQTSQNNFELKSSRDGFGSDIKVANVKWHTFTEGIKKAKAEKKPILVDFYTDWCTYCKKMEKETYSQKNLYDYLNKNFINIKVNAESQKKVKFAGKDVTEQELAMGFQVNSYPTMFFMASETETIGTAPGFIDANQFFVISKYVGSESYKKMSLENYRKAQKT